jgi:hypothetical protein
MDPKRVAELHDPHRMQGGSGYLIRDNLILTAHHVIAPLEEKGILGRRYHLRLIGDYEAGRTDWIIEGCYLCWDSPQYDLALLKLEEGKLITKFNQQSVTCFGELANTQLRAKGIGFPSVQKINGRQNPEELQGFLSKYSGLKLGQLRLQVTSPIPNSPDQWQGISGTAIFIDQFLVGVVVETNKSFAEKALWATPISDIAEDADFCGLVLGDRNRSLPLESIEGANKANPSIGKDSILDTLLIAPKHKRDAWRRFFEPIELVGREAELSRLEEFAQRPEPFIWQVLYGQHGVGKSRLAKEWLIRLENENSQWTIGFAPDEINGLNQLLNHCPSQSTAIVIDNAENFGDELWTFLYRAHLAWETQGNIVRILFLAHTELEPLSTSFERTQSLKALRESRLVDVREVGAQTQYVKATELIAVPGILLHPLQDQQDQKHILNSNRSTGISEDEVKKLISDTRGLPAFLALAGRYPKDWRKKLEDYAKVIVEQAKSLFGEDNGICVLALSTLIAPVNSSVMERIAPRAWSAKKMEQLFGSNPNILKKEVPVFEPDLLGQEITLQALSMLSDSSAENLCGLIARERPDTFLQKTIEIWQRHADPQGIVDKFEFNLGSSAAQQANLLDTLFDVSTQVAVYSINLPLGRLSQIRGKAYAIALLNPSLPKNQYSKLVDAVLAQTPTNGFSNYLPILHSEAPCSDSNYLKWTALLHYYCASLTDEAPPEIETTRLTNNDLNESFIATILEGLRSSDLFERSFAAYRIGEAVRDRKKSPSDLIPRFAEVLDGLSDMLQKTAAERIAAALAISLIACEPDGKAGWQHFQDIDTDRLLAVAKEHDIDSLTLQPVASALSNIWRSSYQFKTLLHLLDVESQGLSAEFTVDQEVKRKEISVALGSSLRQNSVGNFNSFLIANVCLSLDCFNFDTINHLIWGLSSPIVSQVNKIGIIVRASCQSEEYVIPFLQQCATLQDEQLQAISIACLVKGCAADGIATLKVKELVRILSINLIDLTEEVRCHESGNVWNEPNVSKLREHIKEIYIANNGHLIHKLKARDSTGQWAYYFVLIEPEEEERFMAALKSTETLDLEDYGQVVVSNYGEEPSDTIRDFLKQKYNFDV